MPTTFLSLPSELRNYIYEVLLVDESRVCVGGKHHRNIHKNGLTPGLLATNREVHRETASMLYARNHFDFVSCSHSELVTFFEEIGEFNANHIQRVFLGFPRLNTIKGELVTVPDMWTLEVDIIGRYCARLQTLALNYSERGAKYERRALAGFDDLHQVISQVIGSMDAQFKAMPSQPEIMVQSYHYAWNSHLLPQMIRRGWRVNFVYRRNSGEVVLVPFDEYLALRAIGEHRTLN